jgi:hypothetical protein
MPLNPGITGITNKSGNEIITRISSSYINTAATISIVRTIMHELIHAHLLHLNYGNPGSDMFQSLLAFASAEGYTDQQELHHEFMPTFIDVISQGFYQWDQANNPGNVQPMQFYKDLAWGGLDGTSAFLANFPNQSDRTRIQNVIQREASNHSLAKGTPC